MKPPHVRLPPIACPVCHTPLDAASTFGGGKVPMPTQGDLSCCIKCSAVLQFDSMLNLSQPTPEELARAYAHDPELKADMAVMQRKIRAFNAPGPRKA